MGGITVRSGRRNREFDETFLSAVSEGGQTRRLTPIFEKLEGKVPYDHIRLVATPMEVCDEDGLDLQVLSPLGPAFAWGEAVIGACT